MSISSAMLAGVNGLSANSNALAAISDNIANANTVGYKRSAVDFSSLVNTGSRSSYAAGGVQSITRQFVEKQGMLQASSNVTDLAISGDGFFVTTNRPSGLTPGDPRFFTRAGSFTVDTEGYLKNTAGLYLQGWPADENGVITPDTASLSNLVSLNILRVANTAQATTNASIQGNLNADQEINANIATYAPGTMAMYAADPTDPAAFKPDFSITVPVSDSKGGQRNLVIDFIKSDVANTWYAEMRSDPLDDIENAAQPGMIASGEVVFNPDGSIDTALTTLPTSIVLGDSLAGAEPKWAVGLGVDAQTIDINLGNMSQFSAVSSVRQVETNGTAFGSMAGLTIDEAGYVTAVYDNGTTRRIGQVAIATFPNPNGLKALDGNAYQVTATSGSFTLKPPGIAGAGELSPSSLEASTVDLSTEFTGLITTQRAYSASSKIITTADQMLEELLSIKR